MVPTFLPSEQCWEEAVPSSQPTVFVCNTLKSLGLFEDAEDHLLPYSAVLVNVEASQ